MTPPEILFEFLPEEVLTPEYIDIPGIPPMPRDPEDWQRWARLVLVEREKVAQRCAVDADYARVQKALCKQPHGLGQAYFAIMFGWIYEPREDDDSAVAPFLLYPRQAEFLFALDGVMQRPKGPLASLALPKARGVGATWLLALDDCWRFLFKKMYQGRLVSRTEDMVDAMGNSDSWMFKHDYILGKLPHFLTPDGFSVERRAGNRCRTHMKIWNPETGSAIIGEATTSGIGVGGRATRYNIDEAARIAGLKNIWAQLGETTNHRIAVSTHNIEESTDFWDMVNASNGWPETVVFEMPWRSVITRDEHWLNETRKTMPHDMFEREIMMNPWEGISSWVYPRSKAITPQYLDYRRDWGPVIHTMDDGYDDDFALIWAQHDPETGKVHILDAYSNSHLPIDFYGHLIRGEALGDQPWDGEALRIMNWISKNQTYKGVFTGDRHGDNTDLSSGESPWKKLERKFQIYVQPSPINLNTLKDRRDALSSLLERMEFSDTPGAQMALQALQNNRFPTAGKNSQATHEVRRPIHDWSSHLTTALEYLAIYLASRTEIGGHMKPREPGNAWIEQRRDTFGRFNNTRVIA